GTAPAPRPRKKCRPTLCIANVQRQRLHQQRADSTRGLRRKSRSCKHVARPATASGRNRSTVANHQRRREITRASTRIEQRSVFARNRSLPRGSPFHGNRRSGGAAHQQNMRRTENRTENYSANNHPRERTEIPAPPTGPETAAAPVAHPPRKHGRAPRAAG